MKLESISAIVIGAAFLALGQLAAAETHIVQESDGPEGIQNAVDDSAPGDTILVGPGTYNGAVTFWELEFVGDGAVINRGSSHSRSNGYDDAFEILGLDASGTTIAGFSIENVSWGVFVGRADDVNVTDLTIMNGFVGVDIYRADGTTVQNIEATNVSSAVSGYLANDVTIENLEITNAYHPIEAYRCSGWEVVHNRIDGMVPAPPGEENQQDGILFATWGGTPVRDNYIAYNWIRDERDRVPGFNRDMSAGIVLLTFGGLLENNVVMENEVEVKIEGLIPEANDSASGIVIGALAGQTPRDPWEVTGNVIVENDVLRTEDPIVLIEDSDSEGFLEANNIIEDNRVE